jgi:hypothetical protein
VLDLGVQRGSRVMLTHKFKIGQNLFPARQRHTADDLPDGAYVIIKRLPKRDGQFEYQIRSVNDLHEGIAREAQLRTNPKLFA